MNESGQEKGSPEAEESALTREKVALLLEKWDKESLKGSPARKHQKLVFPFTEMYVCPNGVGVLVLAEDVEYSLCDIQARTRIEKGIPLVRIGDEKVSFPFPVRVIEIWERGKKPYISVVQVLGQGRDALGLQKVP